ncbi:MAG: hypothetical protein ACTHY4_01165 [Flavobacteriaceae bacterium]|nr:DUF1217 domain-containing protein [Psychroflexus sp.]
MITVFHASAQLPVDEQKKMIGEKIDALEFTDYILNVSDQENFENKFKILVFWSQPGASHAKKLCLISIS